MRQLPDDIQAKLKALIEISQLELIYLEKTDNKLFSDKLTSEMIVDLANNDALSERIDAFVARFGRLQDTLGDKFLPLFLKVMEESTGTMLENLDRVERLEIIHSSDDWVLLRKLRNRMIHEYVRNSIELSDALNAAHEFIPEMKRVINKLIARIQESYQGF